MSYFARPAMRFIYKQYNPQNKLVEIFHNPYQAHYNVIYLFKLLVV